MKLNKQIVSGALALLMATTPTVPYNVLNDSFIISEAAETYTDSDGVAWAYTILNENSLQITTATLPSGATNFTVTIPSKINEIPVTQIGNSVFLNNKNIDTIVLNHNITRIGNQTFKGCSVSKFVDENGKENTIPSSVINIGYNAFYECSNLKVLEIEENEDAALTIGSSAFFNSGIEEVTLPDNLTTIPKTMFKNCKSLRTVNIPDNVTMIQDGAFYGCSSLSEIEIPDIVTYLGAEAFQGCSSLVNVKLPNSTTIIFNSIFEDCSKLETVIMPTNLTSIEYEVFQGCSSLKNITIPNSVTTIGNGVFKNCSTLKELTLPSSLKKINAETFYGCSSLQNLTITSNISEIGDSAFEKCESIEELDIPNTVTTIGDNLFSGCKSLKEAFIPSNTTVINSGLFKDCSSLETVTIPNNISEIKDNSFYGCSALTDLSIPETVTVIEDNAFYGCSGIENIVLPNALSQLGEGVFEQCRSLKSINIPESITIIPEKTFSDCNMLEELTIHKNITQIQNYAFKNCTSLPSIDITNKITSIGNGAFENCTSIESVTIPSNVKTLGGFVFKGCTSLKEILYIAYNKELPVSMFHDCSSLEEIVILSDLTTINSSAFENCSALQSIELPDKLKYINESAFAGCSSLNNITIPENVISIKENAFQNCTSLESINIPEGIDEINEGLFDGCIMLSDLDIEGTITSINANAFKNCSSLTELYLSDDISELGDDAFEGCTSLVLYSHYNLYVKKYAKEQGLQLKYILNNEYATVVFSQTNISYNGSELHPEVTVLYGDKELSTDDYDVTYSNNTNVGEGIVTVIGKNEFEGTLTAEFSILPGKITEIILSSESYIYDGTEKKPEIIAKCGDNIISADDYEVTYENNIETGTATVIVTGKGNFEGTITKTFRIVDKEITSIELSETEFEYTGNSIEPTIIVKSDNDVIDINNYEIVYTNNTNVGTATITVIGKGLYGGQLTKTFSIIPTNITAIELENDIFIYDGTEKKPNIEVKKEDTVIGSDNYTVKYSNNVNAGTATVTVTAKGNYDSTLTKTFIINPANITSVTLDNDSFVYNGTDIQPQVTVKCGDNTLSSYDYDVSYSNNSNVGTATIIITGKGNFAGTLTKDYTITPANITSVTLDSDSCTYDGTEKKPVLTIKSNDITLSQKDYIVEYSNNINVGTATVTVTGKGNYTGIITKTFTINSVPSVEDNPSVDKPSVEKPSTNDKNNTTDKPSTNDKNNVVDKNPSTSVTVNTVKGLKQKAVYKTNAITLTWSKVANATGYEIYRATKSNGKYVKIGTTTKAPFINKSLKAGTMYYYKVRAYKTVNGVKTYGAYSGVIKAQTKTAAPKIKKIIKTKNKATIKIKKVKGANGYVVYVKVGKKFVKKATVKKPTAIVKKIKKVKRYTFKVKSYSIINGKKVYSSMSKAYKK